MLIVLVTLFGLQVGSPQPISDVLRLPPVLPVKVGETQARSIREEARPAGPGEVADPMHGITLKINFGNEDYGPDSVRFHVFYADVDRWFRIKRR
jgi:hypothetical protein